MRRSVAVVGVVTGVTLACGGSSPDTPGVSSGGPTPGVSSGGPTLEPAPVAAPSPAPDAPDAAVPAGPSEVGVVQYGTFYDTACSACTGSPPCVVTEVRASSTLTEGKLVHEASRALDRDLTTAWCEGGGDAGQGTSLTFSIPPGCGLYGVRLHAGYFKSAAHLQDNARVHELELRTDGRRVRAELVDPAGVNFDTAAGAPAFIELVWDDPGKELEVVFTDVFLGKASPKDLCVSDIDVMLYERD